MSKLVGEEKRAAAMDKAFMMSFLFKEPYFSEIENAIAMAKEKPKEAERMFNETFAKHKMAGSEALKPKQKAWLWNYLRNYNSEMDWDVKGDW